MRSVDNSFYHDMMVITKPVFFSNNVFPGAFSFAKPISRVLNGIDARLDFLEPGTVAYHLIEDNTSQNA